MTDFFEYAIVDVGDDKIAQHAVMVAQVLCERRNLHLSSVRVSPLMPDSPYPVTRTVAVYTQAALFDR